MALDKRVKNILFMALEDELFENVINCKTAQEVWEALLMILEETEEVREKKQSLLSQQYEMFSHVSDEDIIATYERFNISCSIYLEHLGKSIPTRASTLKS